MSTDPEAPTTELIYPLDSKPPFAAALLAACSIFWP